jgi:hypothetical protein
MRAAAFLVALPLAAQSISTVQVIANANRVVAGRTLQFSAVGRDNSGAINGQTTWRWTVSDANVASISSDGVLTARNLGVIRVRATATNNAFNEMSVQVTPARMEMDPPEAEMTIGERRRFTARFFDANGNALPVNGVQWSVLSGVGFNSVAASIDNTGMLRAISEADLIVRALFNFPNNYIPGFQSQAQVTARLRIRPRQDFRLSRLFTSGMPRTESEFRFKPSILAMNDRSQSLWVASFGGQAVALLHREAGQAPEPLLWGGITPGPLQATVSVDFFAPNLNNRGQIAVMASTFGTGNVLWRGTRDRLQPVLWDNMMVGGLMAINSLRLSRCALADDGSLTVLLNFRQVDDPATYTGLVRFDPQGLATPVVTSIRPLDGLEGPPLTFENDYYGTAPDQVTFFVLARNTQRALYRQQGGNDPVKIIGIGDALDGSTLSAFMGASMFFVGRTGDVAVGLRLANNTNWLYYLPQGDWSRRTRLQLNGWTTLQAVHSNQGVLGVYQPTGRNNGLYLWRAPEPVRQIFEYGRLTLAGGLVDGFDAAGIDLAGRVTAILRSQAAPQLVADFTPDASVVVKSGDPSNFGVPLNLYQFVPGLKNGPLQMINAALNGSVWARDGGDLAPALLQGTRIDTSAYFTGASTGNTRIGPDNRVYTTQTNGWGVVRTTGTPGRLETVLVRNGRIADGTTLFSPYDLRVNARGDLLTSHSTDRSDNRLVLTRAGQNNTQSIVLCTNGSNAQFVTTIDGFGEVIAWSDQQLDDAGRVLAILRARDNSVGLFLWENGRWRSVWRPNDTIGNRITSNIFNVKVAGERFFFRIQVPGGVAGVAKLEGGRTSIVLDPEEITANGVIVNSVGAYDVNSRGDIFFVASAFGQNNFGVKRGDEMLHVYANTGATADGDVWWRLVDLDIRDDGSLHVIIINLFDQVQLYRCEIQ